MVKFWKDEAACKGMGKLFFKEDRQAYNEARFICFSCPVLEDCREDSVKNETPSTMHGFKAGMAPKTRKQYVLDKRRLLRLEGNTDIVVTHHSTSPYKATA